MRLIGWLVRLLLWGVVLGVPLAGMWLASSMAALLNGPVWLTVLGGALLFPILPLLWDGLATWRKRRKAARRKSSSSFLDDLSSNRRAVQVSISDRLMLRTLVLNGLFLAVLLGQAPATAANALAARGDWMLDDVEAPWTDDARAVIFALADRAESLAEEENTWAELGEAPPPPPPSPDELADTARAPAPAVLIPVMPDGATGRITGTELTVEDGVPLPLKPGAYEMTAMLADGRGIACPIRADWAGWQSDEPSLGLVSGDPWYLGPEPCLQFQAPDPTWRPSLKLVQGVGSTEMSGALSFTPVGGEPEWLILGEEVVPASGITAVQIREPYVRLTLTEEASSVLCEKTDSRYLLRLAAVADGEVRYTTPVHEKLCSGTVSLPMTAAVSQRGGLALAEAITGQVGGDASRWQHHTTPHTILDTIPPEMSGSVQNIGRYLKAQLPDPYERARAVHDYVVTHVDYDVQSLEPGKRAPQDADTVFSTGMGVCAGYANLMVALGEAAGLEVVYLVGHSREHDGGVAGSMHAWNAVKLEGKWYLIDATWDAGSVGPDGYRDSYKTDYLLTPPEIFRITHLPEDEAWQLTSPPMSRGDIIRTPMLRPAFYAAGLSLVGVDRSQVTVRDTLTFSVRNPQHGHLLVDVETDGGDETRCELSGQDEIRVTCRMPGPGQHTVSIYHNTQRHGSYAGVGSFQVNVPR